MRHPRKGGGSVMCSITIKATATTSRPIFITLSPAFMLQEPLLQLGYPSLPLAFLGTLTHFPHLFTYHSFL